MTEIERIIQTGDKDQVEAVLGQLSHAELVKIASGVREVERRKAEEGIRYYEPYNNPGYQLDFHKSKAFIRMVLKGNKAGGTHAHGAEVTWQITGTHPWNQTAKPPLFWRWVTTDFKTGVKKIAHSKFKELLPRSYLIGDSWEKAYSKEDETLYLKDGGLLEFMTYDQEPEKHVGVDRHGVSFDEPPPKSHWDENLFRVSRFMGVILLTATMVNLDASTSWIYDFWHEQKQSPNLKYCEIFNWLTEWNKSLNQEWFTEFKKTLTPEEIAPRLMGTFAQLFGLVYKNFSRAKNVIKPFKIPEHWTNYAMWDIHPRAANGLIFWSVNSEGEIYIWGAMKKEGTAKTVLTEYRSFPLRVQYLTNKKIEANIADNSVNDPNQSVGRSTWFEFIDPDRDGSNKGITLLTVSRADKDQLAGIRAVSDYLGYDGETQKPKLYIFDDCPGFQELMAEFETYIWDDHRDKHEHPLLEKPKKTPRIHLMDCIRYGLMYGTPYVKMHRAENNFKGDYNYLNRVKK